MRTFVLMSKLAPHGPSVVETVSSARKGPENHRTWIEEVRQQCPEVEFMAHFALLGSWDFMDIYRAPDEESAARVSMICTGCGAYQVESWCAIPDERLQEIAGEISARMQ